MNTRQTMTAIAAESVSNDEINQRIAEYYSAATFTDMLQASADSDELMLLVGRYIHYCSVFGASQANLAGAIGVRQELFRDPNEAGAMADVCAEVAAGVFFGAIDEFYDRDIPGHMTHRALAQATLKGLARFYDWDSDKLERLIHHHRPTIEAMQRGTEGYGVGMAMDEAKLFRAFGFHLGTEILADEEFCLLDQFFQARRPDIVDYLTNTPISVHGVSLPAYFWIGRHTIADAEHFDAAVDCAALALKYYAGGADRGQAKAWILEGVAEIAELERDFMSAVLTELA